MLKHYLRNPKHTGMVVPSSKQLSKAMTHDLSKFDCILEVGAGTGAITKELANRVPLEKLQVFEYDESLCENLINKFFREDPTIVKQGPVHCYAKSILSLPEKTLIISSLPFKSLPKEVKADTVDLFKAFVQASPDRCIYQYSYIVPFFSRTPFNVHAPLHWKQLSTIMGNIPPAKVWMLRRYGHSL